MYLVKILNVKKVKDRIRWIQLDNKMFLIKQLNNREIENIIQNDAIEEFYKLHRNSMEIIKTKKLKLFSGISL